MTSFEPLIKFPCRCGHRFALPADRAASEIQCPRCGLLNDVPGIGDLESLSDDGTLLLRPDTTRPEPGRAADVKRYFHSDRVDDAGEEIDLRNSHADLADVGAPLEGDVIPLRDDDARPNKPKYDPETGELIRPIPIAPRADLEEARDAPVARRALSYAGTDVGPGAGVRRVFVDLCMPANLVVMLFVMVLHAFHLAASVVALGGLFFVAPVAVGLTVLILAHYGNTIDETGPEARDELPRPIRGMSFADDIWNPFCHLAGALMMCYLPAWFAYTRLNLPAAPLAAVTGLLALAGTFCFPAVALTLHTGGVLNNMRPDRVLGVVRVAGWQYGVSVFAWVATLVLYAVAGAAAILLIERLFSTGGSAAVHAAVAFALLLVAVYVAHFFCWHLGLIYRRGHARFPWVLQRHVSTRARTELEQAAAIRARRRKPRYVGEQNAKLEDGG